MQVLQLKSFAGLTALQEEELKKKTVFIFLRLNRLTEMVIEIAKFVNRL